MKCNCNRWDRFQWHDLISLLSYLVPGNPDFLSLLVCVLWHFLSLPHYSLQKNTSWIWLLSHLYTTTRYSCLPFAHRFLSLRWRSEGQQVYLSTTTLLLCFFSSNMATWWWWWNLLLPRNIWFPGFLQFLPFLFSLVTVIAFDIFVVFQVTKTATKQLTFRQVAASSSIPCSWDIWEASYDITDLLIWSFF
jgi:hypothetical protein